MSELYTIGSVCSGIEAATVALGPIGFKALWLAEIEPAPCRVLEHHYPDVPNLGDMTKIAALIRDCFVPAPDMLCGGTPCQAFSIAGLRNSLDDERGNLSLIFCEIADEIDKRRAADGLLPSVILWENVPGVLSTSDNAFGCFLAGLAGEDDPIKPPGAKWTNAGCVYGPKRTVAWRVFDAQYFGVAQRRRRVFVVASAREGFDPAEVLFEFDGMRRDSPPSREAGQGFTHDVAPCLTSSGRGVERGGDTRGQDPVVAIAFGGNNQSGAIDIATARNACSSGSGRLDFETETFLVQSVSLRGREGGATAELGGTIAGTLRASSGGGDKAHVLAPITFDSRQDCVSSSHVFGALGSSSPQAQAVAFAQNSRDEVRLMNGDGQIVGALAAETGAKQQCYIAQCVTGDITHTIKDDGINANESDPWCGKPIVAAYGISNQPTPKFAYELSPPLDAKASGGGRMESVFTGMAVRRLTPVECARLQGFEDDYLSQVMVRGKPMADGPMYKALGNSWAVPNVSWIGRRIHNMLSKGHV